MKLNYNQNSSTIIIFIGCRNPNLSGYQNLERWYDFIAQQDVIRTTIAKYPLNVEEVMLFTCVFIMTHQHIMYIVDFVV